MVPALRVLQLRLVGICILISGADSTTFHEENKVDRWISRAPAFLVGTCFHEQCKKQRAIAESTLISRANRFSRTCRRPRPRDRSIISNETDASNQIAPLIAKTDRSNQRVDPIRVASQLPSKIPRLIRRTRSRAQDSDFFNFPRSVLSVIFLGTNARVVQYQRVIDCISDASENLSKRDGMARRRTRNGEESRNASGTRVVEWSCSNSRIGRALSNYKVEKQNSSVGVAYPARRWHVSSNRLYRTITFRNSIT